MGKPDAVSKCGIRGHSLFFEWPAAFMSSMSSRLSHAKQVFALCCSTYGLRSGRSASVPFSDENCQAGPYIHVGTL